MGEAGNTHLRERLLDHRHLRMEILRSLIPVRLVFRIHLLAESRLLLIHHDRKIIHPVSGHE